MASGTGISNTGGVAPLGSTTSMGVSGSYSDNMNAIHNSYKIDTPSSMGGNTASYESSMSGPIWKGGYIPRSIKKRRPRKGAHKKSASASAYSKSLKGGKKRRGKQTRKVRR
jgi:hypothetical protein